MKYAIVFPTSFDKNDTIPLFVYNNEIEARDKVNEIYRHTGKMTHVMEVVNPSLVRFLHLFSFRKNGNIGDAFLRHSVITFSPFFQEIYYEAWKNEHKKPFSIAVKTSEINIYIPSKLGDKRNCLDLKKIALSLYKKARKKEEKNDLQKCTN